MQLVRMTNAVTIEKERGGEHDFEDYDWYGDLGNEKLADICVGGKPKLGLYTRDQFVTYVDPACGSGRFGMDAIAMHPLVDQWNVEIDLWVYRMAVLNARMLLPFSNVRIHLEDDPRYGDLAGHNTLILMGRVHCMNADSLFVDISSRWTWGRTQNRWDPVDWRTNLVCNNGYSSFQDMEQEIGENHAIDRAMEYAAEKFKVTTENQHAGPRVTPKPPLDVLKGKSLVGGVEGIEDEPALPVSPPRPEIQESPSMPTGLPSMGQALAGIMGTFAETERDALRYLEAREQRRKAKQALLTNAPGESVRLALNPWR
jgi:hypothetical protein